MKKFTLLFSAILCLAGLWQGHAQNGGDDCASAVVVTPGSFTDTVITDNTPGANNGDEAWFAYTPTDNGTINVNSCDGGADSRLFIYDGDCAAPNQIATNDDAPNCIVGGGTGSTSNFASRLEDISVTAGMTYFIVWDDRYASSLNPFDWSFDFVIAPDCPETDNLSADIILEQSASFTWDAVTEATNGYTFTIVEEGGDPDDVNDQIFQSTPDAAAVSETASGLSSGTAYDAYLVADCDTNGVSLATMISFTTLFPVPDNDACVNATEVTAFPYMFTQDDTAGATNNDGFIFPTGCGFGMNDGVWYTLTGDGSEITVTTTPDGWDSELGIYTGTCGSFVCVESSDSGGGSTAEDITFISEVGTVYYINIGHWSGSTDNPEAAFDISITSEEIIEPTGCGQSQVSNAFENGLFMEEGSFQVANDIVVTVNQTNLNLTTVTANLFSQGGIASVDIIFYEDNNGVPGTQFGATIEDLVPTSQEIIGNNFGYDVHETVLDLPTAIDFPGTGTEDVRYWMQLVGVPTVAATRIAWEVTSVNPIGLLVHSSPAGPPVWAPSPDGEDGVFTLTAECESVDGCLAVENLTVSDIDDTSAVINWDDSPTATDGFLVEVVEAGNDPDTDPVIFTASPAAGTTMVTATPLLPDTAYDVYVTTDCGDDEGVSVMQTFTTAPAPPDNDDACDAIALTVDAECTGAIYTNTAATTETGEPEGDCFVGGAQATVWFTFEAPDNGSVIITTDLDAGVATNTDTEIALYEAPTDCTDLSTFDPAIACDQDGGVDIIFNSIIETEGLTPGETYYVQVSGYFGASGTFCIEVQAGPDCPEVENFAVANVTQTAADFSWDPIANADNGYVISVFEAGTTTGPVDNVAVAAGTTTYSTGDVLVSGTEYDAYLTADCDAGGLSEPVTLTFRTLFPDALPEECGGQFVDSGNTNGSYQNGESITTVLTPDNAGDAVSITFTYVDIESSATGAGTRDGCWDYLTIYDGSDASAPVIANTLCGEESGDGGTPSVPTSLLSVGDSFEATNPDGTLTIVFTSDTSVPETGWLADITCAPLAIEDFTFANFNYHPNPTTGILNVNAKSAIESIELYNILGQQVLQVRPDALDAVLDLTELSSGTYMMKSTVNGSSYTHKVIKD